MDPILKLLDKNARMPVDEIAAAVGLTEKTVTVRLARIRGKMKAYLEESEGFVCR